MLAIYSYFIMLAVANYRHYIHVPLACTNIVEHFLFKELV